MKIYVQSADGELVFPSFMDFQQMYRLKFVSPDDLVRRETSNRWIRAGDLPELRAMHLYEPSMKARHVTTAMWLLVGLMALAVMLQWIVNVVAVAD